MAFCPICHATNMQCFCDQNVYVLPEAKDWTTEQSASSTCPGTWASNSAREAESSWTTEKDVRAVACQGQEGWERSSPRPWECVNAVLHSAGELLQKSHLRLRLKVPSSFISELETRNPSPKFLKPRNSMKVKQSGYLFLPIFKKFFSALPLRSPSGSIVTWGETTGHRSDGEPAGGGGDNSPRRQLEGGGASWTLADVAGALGPGSSRGGDVAPRTCGWLGNPLSGPRRLFALRAG